MVDYYSRLLTITAAAGSIKSANAGLFDRQQSTPLITSEDVPLDLPDIDIDEPSNTNNNSDNDEPVIISSSPLIAIEEPQDDTTNAAIIATPTICKSFSECQTAASALNIPLYTSEHLQLHTKGCYIKNNNAFWSPGTIDEISNTDLPELQSRLYCNNYSAQTISVLNSFPQLVMPTWTAIQYWNDDNELVAPIYNTAITLSFDIFNDMKGETGCNAYFGRYKELTSTSFEIDGAIGQTLIGCGDELAEQESSYLNNWMSSNTTLIKWRIKPSDNTLELKNGNTNQLIGIYKTICMTEQQCDEAAQKLNIPVGYSNDDFPTKGCFTKNNVVYWSMGSTVGSMAEVDLPGVQERIYCPVDTSTSNDDILDSGGKEDTAVTNSPVASPKKEISVSVFDIDKKDEGEEKQEDSALKASSGVVVGMKNSIVVLTLGMAVVAPLFERC